MSKPTGSKPVCSSETSIFVYKTKVSRSTNRTTASVKTSRPVSVTSNAGSEDLAEVEIASSFTLKI
jgi:hypothetical protein